MKVQVKPVMMLEIFTEDGKRSLGLFLPGESWQGLVHAKRCVPKGHKANDGATIIIHEPVHGKACESDVIKGSPQVLQELLEYEPSRD